MSYANAPATTYSYPAQNFASAVITRAIKPPRKKNRGVILDITAAVVVTFTQTTTPGFIQVGTAATANLYAELNMGAAAGGTCYNDVDFPAAIKGDIDFDRDGVTAAQLKTVAPTGGSPAGTCDIFLSIRWS